MSQSQKLSNVKNVYCHQAPFIMGRQDKKLDSNSGYDFTLAQHGLEVRKGKNVTIVPYANIVSITYEETDAPKPKG